MKKIDVTPYIRVFTSRKIASVAFFGFSSGLPLALTGGSLQAWMTVSGVDLRVIGVFALVGLPYTLKFLWAPLMDRFVPPWLGRRRGWIVCAQLALSAILALMGMTDPASAPAWLAVLALSAAFASASQDIVIDAYRTDILGEKERGAGVAVFVTGYRIAMIVSGAMALILADQIGWERVYLLMAGLMAISALVTFVSQEPDGGVITAPGSLREAIEGPLKDYFTRNHAIAILLLIILYKLGDAYAGSLSTAFLIRGVGFSQTEVGAINKGFGLAATIGGALAGGALMAKVSLYRSLMGFGVLQAVSNLSFTALAVWGKSYPLLFMSVGFENISGGMGSAAFVSLLMALCDRRFSATQYAILSSLSALGRTFVAPTSGFLVEAVGWPAFFVITAVTALPGLFLLRWLRPAVDGLKPRN
ncbi:MAG: MFS transporter [Nitrospinae bacterium]|nr:MFS transporter [Nitrospinota bacterium]MBF0633344.1 MFS transporter [Nitrospinota bacterium]